MPSPTVPTTALADDPNAWRARGLCAAAPDLPTPRPATPEGVRDAKWVCRRCPSLAPCKAWVLDLATPAVDHGVVGGMAAKERERARRDLRRAAVDALVGAA